MEISELWERVVGVLFPPRCVLCDEVVEFEALVCESCAPDVARTMWSQGRTLCALPYQGGVKQAVWRIKRERDKRTVRFLAGQMHRAMAHGWGERRFDLLAPVPMGRDKLRERGFNQAELLAAELARLLALPVEAGALEQREGTGAQHSLDRAARRKNAAEAYRCVDGAPVAGKRVLLVDDVYTTGATLQVCGDLLLLAGALEVCGVTAARTPLDTGGQAAVEHIPDAAEV